MKKLLMILLVLAMLMSTVACSSGAPDGYTSVSREDEIFDLYVPSSWQDNSASGISSAYSSLGSAVMASATTQYVADDITLDEYLEAVLQSYESTLPGFKKLSEPAATTLGSFAAYRFDYQIKSNELTTSFRCTVAKNENYFTILSCCAPEADFADNAETFDEIASNFAFRELPKEPETETEEPFIFVDEHTPEGFHLASHSKLEYRLFVPNTWIIDTKSGMPSAKASNTELSHISMTTIVRRDGITNGKEYWEMFKKNYEFELTEIATDENAKLGEYTAFAVEYTNNILGLKYHNKQVMLTTSDIIYVLTFTADDSSYDKYLSDFDTIASMFEFK